MGKTQKYYTATSMSFLRRKETTLKFVNFGYIPTGAVITLSD